MLVKFIDEWYRKGSIPYDEISSMRQDNDGFGVIRCKGGEVITTRNFYEELVEIYENTIIEDIEMMMGDDDGEDV